MPGARDDLETRARERLRVALAALEGDDAIVAAPDDQRRRGDAAEEMRERRAIHIRLPSDAERHLTVQVPLLQLGSRRIGAEDAVARARVRKAEAHVVDVGDERLIGDLAP